MVVPSDSPSNVVTRDREAHALGDFGGALRVGRRQDRHEFLAAPAAERVALAQRARAGPSPTVVSAASPASWPYLSLMFLK